MEDQVRELTSQLQSKIGDSLRAVGVYSRDTNTVIYVRDDLREAYGPEDFSRFGRLLRELNHKLVEIEDVKYPIGDVRASTLLFERSILVQLILGRESGVIIAVDADVGCELTDFVETSKGFLEEADSSLGDL